MLQKTMQREKKKQTDSKYTVLDVIDERIYIFNRLEKTFIRLKKQKFLVFREKHSQKI